MRKENVFLWRFLSDALATRINLSKKGIPLQSMACIFYDNSVETFDHRFFSCSSVSSLWRKIWAWWGLKSPMFSSVDMFKKTIQKMSQNRRWGNVFFVVCAVAIWQLWKWRNVILFAKGDDVAKKKSEDPFLVIQNLSKLWISNRKHNLKINWDNWCVFPFFV